VKLHRFLAWFCLVLVIATGAAIWFVPPIEDFQPDNPFWNGSRRLSDVASIKLIDAYSQLPASPQGATLIVIPYRQFDPGDLEALNRFVADGGVLVLADDFGWGNQVLEYLGLEARFSGQALIDPLFYYKSRWFPRADASRDDPFTAGMEHFNLNYATVLVGVPTDNVLATSSSFSFLDTNANGSADKGETVGRQVVMSRQTLGQGQVVLLSDPSVFISSMMTGDNLKLAENIAATSETGVYFDQSHLVTSNLRQAKDWLRTLREFAFKPPVAVALVVVILAITFVPVLRKNNNKRNGQDSPGKE
jgi:hypothetical protein